MNLTDQYIPLENIPKKSLPALSRIASPGNKVRVQNCLLEVVSINDRKQTITFKLGGVFPEQINGEDVKVN